MEERDYISDSDWGGYERSLIHESDSEDSEINLTIENSKANVSRHPNPKEPSSARILYQRNLRARDYKQLKPYSYVKEHFKSVFGDRSRKSNQHVQLMTGANESRDSDIQVRVDQLPEETDIDVPLKALLPNPAQPDSEQMDIDSRDDLEDEINALFGPGKVNATPASNGLKGHTPPSIPDESQSFPNGETQSILSQQELVADGWNRRRLRPRQEDQLHPYQADAERYGKVRITELSQDHEYSPSSSDNEDEIFNLDNPVHSDGSVSSPEPSLGMPSKGGSEYPQRYDPGYDSLDDEINSIFGLPHPEPRPMNKPLSNAPLYKPPDRSISNDEAMEADSIAHLTAVRSRPKDRSQVRRRQGGKGTQKRKNKVSIVDYLEETARGAKRKTPRFSRVAAASVRRKKNVRRDNISQKYISINSSDENDQSEAESSEWISRVNTLLRGSNSTPRRANYQPNARRYHRHPGQRSINDFLAPYNANISKLIPSGTGPVSIPRRKSNRAVKVIRSQSKSRRTNDSRWVTIDAESETGKYAIGRNHYPAGPVPDFLRLMQHHSGTSDQLSTSVLPYPNPPQPQEEHERLPEMGLEQPGSRKADGSTPHTRRPSAIRKFARKAPCLSGNLKITNFLSTSKDVSSFGIDSDDQTLHFDANAFVNSKLFSAAVNREEWFQARSVFEYHHTIISVFDDEWTVQKALDSCIAQIINDANSNSQLSKESLLLTEQLFEFLVGGVAAKRFDRLAIMPFLDGMNDVFVPGDIPPDSPFYKLRLTCLKHCLILRFQISDITLEDERSQFLDSARSLLSALLEESALYDMLQASRRFKTLTRDCCASESVYILLTLLRQARNCHQGIGLSGLMISVFPTGPFTSNEIPLYDRIWLTMFLFTKYGKLEPFKPQVTSEWDVIVGLVSKLKDHFASSSDVVESAAYFEKCLLRSLALIVRFGWCGNPGFVQKVFEIFKDRMFKNFSPPHFDSIPDFLLKTLSPKSPNFLKQLSPQPHDSSFHLFLKIYILTLSRNDLPPSQINLLNGRTILQKKRFIKRDEDFIDFEASSLANDFWFNAVKFVYSPPNQRPNILSIKNRVDIMDSHVRAKLLSSRAWYVVSRIAIGRKEYSKQISQWLNELISTGTSDVETSQIGIDQVFSELLRNIRHITSDVGIITNPQWPSVLLGSIGSLANMKSASMELKVDVLETLFHGIQLYDNVRYLDDASTSDDLGGDDSIAGPLSEQVNQVHFIQFLDTAMSANLERRTIERILVIFSRFALLFIQSGKDWPYVMGEWAQNGFCWSYLNHSSGKREYQSKWLALVLSKFGDLDALADLDFYSTTFIRPFCIDFIQSPDHYTLELFVELRRLPPLNERLSEFRQIGTFGDMTAHRDAILSSLIPSVSRTIVVDIVNTIKLLPPESTRNLNGTIQSIRQQWPSLSEAYNLKVAYNHAESLRLAISGEDKPRAASTMMKILAESLVEHTNMDWKPVFLELTKRPNYEMFRFLFVDIVRSLLNSASESATVVGLLMLEELLRLAYMVLRSMLSDDQRHGQSSCFKMAMSILSYAKTSTRRTLWLVIAPIARLARDWAITASAGAEEYLDAMIEGFADLLEGVQDLPPGRFKVEQFVHTETSKAVLGFEWSDEVSTWVFNGKEVKFYDEQAYRESAIRDIIELLAIRCHSPQAAEKARRGLNNAMLTTVARWNDLFINDDRISAEIDDLVI